MKKLTKAASLLAGVSVAEMVFRFLRTKCVAVVLGTAGTGFIAQLGLFFEALRVWGALGSRRALIRHIAQHRREDAGYADVITTSFFLAGVASFALAAGVTLFAPVISRAMYGSAEHAGFVAAVGWILPVASLVSLIGSVMKGNLAVGPFVKITVAAYLGAALCVVPLVVWLGAWGAVIGQFLFFALPLIGYAFYQRRSPFLFFSKRIDFGVLKEESLYQALNLYSNTVNRWIKVAVAAWITRRLGLDAMGYYQVVITLSVSYLSIPVQSISGYTLPLIARAGSNREIGKAVNDTLRYFLFLLAPVIAMITVSADFVIPIFFSALFLPAAGVLRVQLWDTFFSLFSSSFNSALVARGKIRALFFNATVWPLLYVAGIAAFFPRWGLYGVAAAAVLSEIFSAAVKFLFVRRYFGFRILPKNRRLLFLTFVWLGTAALLGESSLAPAAAAAITAALGVGWFFAGSKDHERQFIAGKIKSFFAARASGA